jgi:hypothetical protein
VQIVAPMLGLLTLVAVTLDSFVKPMIGSGDASLAVVIGSQARRTCEHEKTGQCGRGNGGCSKERVFGMCHRCRCLLPV